MSAIHHLDFRMCGVFFVLFLPAVFGFGLLLWCVFLVGGGGGDGGGAHLKTAFASGK